MSKTRIYPDQNQYLAFFANSDLWQPLPLMGLPELEIVFRFREFIDFIAGNMDCVSKENSDLDLVSLFLTKLRECQIKIAHHERENACLLAIDSDLMDSKYPLTVEAKQYSRMTRPEVVERISLFRQLQDGKVKIPIQ